MATNSTLLQQAFELRKANPNMTVWNAVSQVKANTTPAPVTPAPIQTSTINMQTWEKFQNATTWPYTLENATNNWYVAPQNTVTQNATPPQQPAPQVVNETSISKVAPVSTTPLVSLQQPQQVNKTPILVWMTTDWPKTGMIQSDKSITDRMQLDWKPNLDLSNKHFNIWWPTDMQGILSSMVAWVPVAPQKTWAYMNAKFQHDQFSKYNAMTPTQLLDNLKQGQIGTDMDKLLSQNPSYVQAKTELDKYQKTNKVNNTIKNIYSGMNGTTPETPDYISKVSDDLIKKLWLDKDQTTAQAFSQYVTDDQNVVNYTNQLSGVNKQIAETSKLISDGIKSIKEQKGDMPASALVTYLNSTFREANTTLENLNNTKQYLEADLKNAAEMAYNRFGAVSKDIENNRNIKNSIISQTIQSQFNVAQKQTEAEIANKIAKEAMNDPYKAIPQMIDEYKKLGIPFTRSTQQVIQDFENSGKDLATYLTDLQKLVQSKPEYKRIQAQEAGKWISYQTIGNKVYKNENGVLTETGIKTETAKTPEWKQDTNWNWYNANATVSPWVQLGWQVTWDLSYLADQYPGQAWVKNNNPTGIKTTISDRTKKLLQDAGVQWSEGSKPPSNEGGTYMRFNTIEDWMKAYQVLLTQAWTNNVYDRLKQWVWTSNGDNYATEIMNEAWLNPNQSISFSSLSQDQLNNLLSAQLKRESPGLYKMMSSQSQAGAPKEVTQSDVIAYNVATPTEKAKILKTAAWKQITEQRNKVFTDPNSEIWDILSYSQWGKTINQTSEWQLYKFNQALNQVTDLEKEISKAQTWPILGILRSNNPYDTKAQEIKAQLSALLPNLARGVYWEVGVLTDNDIANYSKTVPNLKSTEEVNKAILAMTLKGIANGYKSKLQSLAAAWYDVSGYEGIYTWIVNTVNWIVPQTQNASVPTQNNYNFQSDWDNL